MKKYKVDRIRNVVLLGHGSSGKTTLAESFLYNSGSINEMGSVTKGSTTSDFTKEEKDRGFSIGTSLIPVEWKKSKYNFLDTPGYFDFVGEVFSSLRVAGGAVIVVDASSGIEVGTEKAWKFTEQRKMPKIIFVNKMDKENVNYIELIKSLKDQFGNKVAPFTIPIGKEKDFTGFVNVVDMVGREYDGKTCKNVDVPEELQPQIKPIRDLLIEAVAESDEAFLDKFFAGEDFTNEEIHEGLRKGVLAGEVVPVVIGSAEKSIGVHTLLDMVYDYMPTPKDMNGGLYTGENPDTNEQEERHILKDDPFSGFVFKTIVDPFIGKISLIKMYSGTLRKGMEVLNANKGEEERINKIYFLSGKEEIDTDEILAGDIGAIAKLDYTSTGDTLCSIDEPILYPGINLPKPALYKSVHAESRDDEGKLGDAIHKIIDEDPALVHEWNSETKETLIGGQGTIQLDVVRTRLKKEFDVTVKLDVPKVAYRETIKNITSVEGKHKKQSGGSGQFGVVQVKFEPTSEEYVFEEKIHGGSVPRQYIPSVGKGIEEAMNDGGLAGFRIVNVKATLFDGKYHPVDSSEQAFKAAGRKALKKAFKRANPVLLEPIMHVEVYVPDENMGDIMGDMNKRRGRVLGMEPTEGGFQKVIAEAPQAELFEYLATLKSITQARGFFSMRFERYEEVPAQIAAKIIEESNRE